MRVLSDYDLIRSPLKTKTWGDDHAGTGGMMSPASGAAATDPRDARVEMLGVRPSCPGSSPIHDDLEAPMARGSCHAPMPARRDALHGEPNTGPRDERARVGAGPERARGVPRRHAGRGARPIPTGCPLRAGHPLVGPVHDLAGDATLAQRGDHQPAARVGRIRLRVARRTERHQAVEIEVRAALGALPDVMHLEAVGGQAAGLAPISNQPGMAEQGIKAGEDADSLRGQAA
jgi:hypothetical protein